MRMVVDADGLDGDHTGFLVAGGGPREQSSRGVVFNGKVWGNGCRAHGWVCGVAAFLLPVVARDCQFVRVC